jgi:hypothetical protein
MLMLPHCFFHTDPTKLRHSPHCGISFSISCCLKSYVLCYESLHYKCFHLAIIYKFMAAKILLLPSKQMITHLVMQSV